MRPFNNNRKIGQNYEAVAEAYLRQQGLHLCERNYQIRGGEIDLIMRHRDFFVFIEVKFRQSEIYGSGLDAIDWRKAQRLRRTALHWLKTKKVNSHMAAIRFDVVYIVDEKVEWLQNVLQEG